MKKLYGFLLAFFLLNQGLVFSAEPSAAAGKLMPREAESDTNGDGKPDRWEHYDGAGNILRAEADTNFDGKVDETAYFENGKMVKVEKDSDYDGKVDKWIKY